MVEAFKVIPREIKEGVSIFWISHQMQFKNNLKDPLPKLVEFMEKALRASKRDYGAIKGTERRL